MSRAPGASRPTARRVVMGAALSAAGVALLGWQISSVGLDGIAETLAQVGWGFVGILALSLVRFALRSTAWIALMGGGASLRSAVGAVITGDAIGNVIPLSLLVSEPAKALYLRDQVPVSRSLPALTAENFFYSVSVAIFVILGTAAMLEAFAVPAELRLAALLSIGLMAVVLVGALWIGWREPALASAVLSRVPLASAAAMVERVRRFETTAYALLRGRPRALAVVVLCEIVFHIVSFAEAYYTLWLMTGQSAPLAAFVLDTFNRIVNVVFRAVPMRVGVDEASSALVAPAVGFNPAVGVTLALVRKGRLLAWAAVGLALAVRKGVRFRDVMHT